MTDISPAKEREIALFWDYENVPLPAHVKPAEAAKAIQSAVSQYGRVIEMRRVYFDPNSRGRKPRDPSGLDSSGFDLVQTPSRNMKETLDKKLIVDVLAFAWGCSDKGREPCVVLITSDGDYAYTLSKLRDKGVKTLVMYGKEASTADILIDNADVALSFENDVLKSIPTKPKPTNAEEASSGTSMDISSRSLNREDSSRSKFGTTSQNMEQGDGDGSFIFVKQLPPSMEPKELASFLQNTHGIQVRWVSTEKYRKDPTSGIVFAHAELVNASDGQYLVALSETKQLLYNGRNLEVKIESRPPSKGDISADMLYEVSNGASANEADNDTGSDMSEMRHIDIDDIDPDVAAFCLCVSEKQKSFSKGKAIPLEECWIPRKIIEATFTPPSISGDNPHRGKAQKSKEARDTAIEEGLVKTARQDADGDFIEIDLGESYGNRKLSKEFYMHVTETGRGLVNVLESDAVELFCAVLYRKQKDWEKGNDVPFKKSHIPHDIMEKVYQPLYPLAERADLRSQCRDTRDQAASMGLIESFRKDGNKDFVRTPLPPYYADLENSIYLCLTESGVKLVERSGARTNMSRRRQRSSENRRMEPSKKAKMSQEDQLLATLSTPR